MPETCAACRWCRQVEADNGQCFNAPPKAVLVTVESFHGPQQTVAGIRPPVLLSDSCADFFPREVADG